MADYELEEALLEAAGRPKEGGGRSHTPSSNKRRRASSMSSDDRSDSSPDNDDEDDDDDFDERGGGRSGEQAKGSKMPLKKRFESSDKDGEDGPRDDGYNSEFSYGSDLYKDEEDRHNLAQMTELEREMELAERSEKRDTWLALRKSRGNRLAEASSRPSHRREKDLGPPSSRMRSSVREGTRSKKENALNELVARRQKAQDPSSLRKRRDSGLTPSRETHSPGRKKPRESLSYSESEPPSEDDADSEREDDEHSDMGGSGDELGDKGEDLAAEDDIKSIVIRRSKLAKWFMEPFFEDIIVGCFVRIGIGVHEKTGQSIYRVCQVKNVDAKDPDKQYKFENFMTCKYLNCLWGASAARWQMVRASDQPASEKEINEFLREVDAAKGSRPLKADVLEKKDAILKVNQFVYSASTVKQMLQEKKMAASRPVNIALEKNRIIKELGIAEEKGEYAVVEKLQSRLKELELYGTQAKSKDAKAMALAEMNRRNRMENFKNASMLKPVNTFAREGEAGYDPFSRRWTRSQNYYQSQPKAEEKETTEGVSAVADGVEKATAKTSEQSEVPKHVESQAAADRRKLYALHDFVLPISLSKLGNTKGPGGIHQAFVQAYMARKAHLEATCGVQVEQNDGRRHSLTLTVNDYKRRRGLL